MINCQNRPPPKKNICLLSFKTSSYVQNAVCALVLLLKCWFCFLKVGHPRPFLIIFGLFLKKKTILKNAPIWPLFVYFRLFHMTQINTNWWKHRWCAWDSNLKLQDRRRRRIHWVHILNSFLASTELKFLQK